MFGCKGDFVVIVGFDGIFRIYDFREVVDEDEIDVIIFIDGFVDLIWFLIVVVDNCYVIVSCIVKMMFEIVVWDVLVGVKVCFIKVFNFF